MVYKVYTTIYHPYKLVTLGMGDPWGSYCFTNIYSPNLLRLEQGAKNEARGVLGRFSIGATGDFMVQMRIKSSVKLKGT